MDRLIRLADKVPLANLVSKQPALRRPPRPFFNVTRLTLAIASAAPLSLLRKILSPTGSHSTSAEERSPLVPQVDALA